MYVCIYIQVHTYRSSTIPYNNARTIHRRHCNVSQCAAVVLQLCFIVIYRRCMHHRSTCMYVPSIICVFLSSYVCSFHCMFLPLYACSFHYMYVPSIICMFLLLYVCSFHYMYVCSFHYTYVPCKRMYVHYFITSLLHYFICAPEGIHGTNMYICIYMYACSISGG